MNKLETIETYHNEGTVGGKTFEVMYPIGQFDGVKGLTDRIYKIIEEEVEKYDPRYELNYVISGPKDGFISKVSGINLETIVDFDSGNIYLRVARRVSTKDDLDKDQQFIDLTNSL